MGFWKLILVLLATQGLYSCKHFGQRNFSVVVRRTHWELLVTNKHSMFRHMKCSARPLQMSSQYWLVLSSNSVVSSTCVVYMFLLNLDEI
jgi:hypothetical protein